MAVLAFTLERGLSQSVPQIGQLNSPQLWQRLEFSIDNVPAAANPFDPDIIRLDATFVLPSGRTITVPAFWYQGYQRMLSSGYEYDAPTGPAGWRLRFTPPETGSYSVSLSIRTNNQPCGGPAVANFNVPASSLPPRFGYVGIAPGGQYFQTGDGQALRLIGENVDWMTTGLETYQYDPWLQHMAAAGENYARLMITPWSFGMETATNTLTHYPLAPAWELDYVIQEAEQLGLYFELCLNIHLMLQPDPDEWGNDNYWQSNPYNAANGGPCVNQDAYFTSPAARAAFQKTLRYVIARYGYSSKLVSWQLWSEIDNEYAYLDPADVAAWHGVMGDWLHTNDPYGHLVTTSLTGGSDRPEIWTLPQMDYACYHCYSEPYPAARLNTVAQSFHQNYGKPVLIDEFGTSVSGWGRENDPYLRGFRQGLWGGALGGSVGTAMSWWWDSIDEENDYSDYTALGSILNRTGWGSGVWTNIDFQTSVSPPPSVGHLTPGGQPFSVVLTPSGVWGAMPTGMLAVTNPQVASYAGATLNSFLLGAWFPTLSVPFALDAWLTNNARVVIHINSVSDSSALAVLVDGSTLFSTNLPNLNGAGNNLVNESYNLDLPVNLPAGEHLIQLTNTSYGWIYLDWVRLEQALPFSCSNMNWQPSPASIGLRGPHESLLYVVAPGVSFSGSDTSADLPLQQGQTVVMSNWPPGEFFAEWYDPATGTNAGYSRASTTNDILTLPVPDFSADLAAIVYPPPWLTPVSVSSTYGFQFQLDSETGGHYLIQRSFDLLGWLPLQNVTNTTGTILLTDPSFGTNAQSFFRASKVN